jgi:DNA gyrase subunit B
MRNQNLAQKSCWRTTNHFFCSLFQREGENCLAEIAFQLVNTNNDNTISFVNNIPTTDWGTHVLGFRSALLNVINELGKEKDKINKKIGEFQYSDVTDGLYAIVSVKIPEPQFEWQTKGRLGNSYVRKEVETITYNYLENFLQNEDEFDKIFEKIELAARARLAAKFAKETVLRKNVLLDEFFLENLQIVPKRKRRNWNLYCRGRFSVRKCKTRSW